MSFRCKDLCLQKPNVIHFTDRPIPARFTGRRPEHITEETTMMNHTWPRAVPAFVPAALALVLAAGPAPAQGRGMMTPMPNRPAMPAMMPGMMPNTMTTMQATAATATLMALQRQQLVLTAAIQRANADTAALMRLPATSGRNFLLLALQRQEAALMNALRQVDARIVALMHP